MSIFNHWPVLCAIIFLASYTSADSPVYCPSFMGLGTWDFYLTPSNQPSSLHCPSERPDITSLRRYTVTLDIPNIATDGDGKEGTWTAFSSQGFEVRIGLNVYFAYYDYTKNATSGKITSYCSQTQPGRGNYHEAGVVPPKRWGCMYGIHRDEPVTYPEGMPHDRTFSRLTEYVLSEVADVNNMCQDRCVVQNNSTRNGQYDLSNGYKVINYGPVDQLFTIDIPRPSKLDVSFRDKYPTSFDWRNVSEVNYVGPSRDQLSCGSCYAFAAICSIESRIRIMSEMKSIVYLAEQDVVSCSPYSEGCSGGFAFCVGKYAHDYGIVELRSFGYQYADVPCNYQHTDGRILHNHYIEDYYYIGGYFNASNEANMMAELHENGPIAVSIYADDGFSSHKSGIYYSPPTYRPDWMPVSNHAVNIVGWGDEDGVPYWILRNSWGTSWGEKGYMRVERGRNSMGIEAQALAFRPLLRTPKSSSGVDL